MYLPVWPHPDYAKACAVGLWSGNIPAPIEIHDFVNIWLPGMKKNDEWLAVFPTPATNNSVPVSAEHLETDLRYELSRIE